MNIAVTGASRGLGLELCRKLLARGDSVWGIARNPIEMKINSFLQSQCDIADPQAIARWMNEMETKNFLPDIVILNAAIQMDDLGSSFDVNAAEETIDVNLTGTLRCIAAILPLFLHRGSGQFIVITSTAAMRPSRRSAGYAASKAGLSMALRSLRMRYRTPTIRFREVCLGPMATEMWEGRSSAIVPTPSAVTTRVLSFLDSRHETLYYPFLPTLLLRLSLFLPDRLFTAISTRFLM